MQGPPIIGCVLHKSMVMSVGQAPGIHEAKYMKPFSYTAGKTLFKWFASIQIKEEDFRKKVQMSAVCRCFPGKMKSGDRKPSKAEVHNCEPFLKFEIKYHKPELVIPIGKLAIEQFLTDKNYKLVELVGQTKRVEKYGLKFDCICLPHPSGINVWNQTKIGKRLIHKALKNIQKHPAIRHLFFDDGGFHGKNFH